MTRRGWWTTGFLGVTAVAVTMELVAGLDSSPDTVPWTELIARYIPAPITMLAVQTLTRWLPGHFTRAYEETGGGPVMGRYAKAVVGALGAGAVALLGIVPPHTTPWIIATVVAAMATAGGVYLTPNTDPAAKP